MASIPFDGQIVYVGCTPGLSPEFFNSKQRAIDWLTASDGITGKTMWLAQLGNPERLTFIPATPAVAAKPAQLVPGNTTAPASLVPGRDFGCSGGSSGQGGGSGGFNVGEYQIRRRTSDAWEGK